jgi:hypothetical protein
MNIFLDEYFFFVSAILGILVCISASALFFQASLYEAKLKSLKRFSGFAILGIAFILSLFERKFPEIGASVAAMEVVGFALIAFGVISELTLTQLNVVGNKNKKIMFPRKDLFQLLALLFLVFLILFVWRVLQRLGLTGNNQLYFTSILQLISSVFIVVTIIFQVKRYVLEIKDRRSRIQNLFPLAGYVFLLVRGLSLVLYRAPELHLVVLHQITLNFSIIWRLSYYALFAGSVFLGIWLWNYIKIRYFLRIYVVFLALGIVMASLGSLIVLIMNFRILESNNLQKLNDHADAINVILDDRLNTTEFLSKLIAQNSDLLDKAKKNDIDGLEQSANVYLEEASLDIIKVYDASEVVIASPSDPRDIGQSAATDPLIDKVYKTQKGVKSFDTVPGVLTPVIVVRSVYPLIDNNVAINAIEVGYRFDSAFVDYVTRSAEYDVTIYTDIIRSASTITTEDDISRWVGTRETNADVINIVMEKGEQYKGITEGLNYQYYSAFSPIKNYEDKVIGMISVSSSTYRLYEDARQNLISTFLIVSGSSLLPTLLGYYAVRTYKSKRETFEENVIEKNDNQNA